MPPLSAAAGSLRSRATFAFHDQVKKMEAAGRSIIHFELGEPDAVTPPHIVDAAVAALRRGETHYTGKDSLSQAITQATQSELGFTPTREQVVIAPAVSFLYTVIRCAANPGDEVIIPAPAYPTYASVCRFQSVRPVPVAAREENGFRLDPADVAAACTEKTRVVVINSPCNPTGAVMTADEVRALSELCTERGIYLLSDETYAQLCFDTPFSSPAAVDGCRSSTVMVRSFSKTYAMTGWRLGWGVGPAPLMEKVGQLLQMIISTVPPFIQEAGAAALTQGGAWVSRQVTGYRQRRDAIVAGLGKIPGVTCVKPAGALYAFPNITGTGMTSAEFVEAALQRANVALLPGTAFGPAGEGYVRLCFATSLANCQEGILRLQRAFGAQDQAGREG
ncbi:MAG: pyridoxal phosphate-dependent aminotransferase [bacterium]|nr:pyridoxal phosphate-dependent aminotransferase [bacterium]